jgi:FkbM family methyltransferase
MPVSRDEVIWAYRLFLGREPESEDAIRHHMKSNSRSALRENMARCPEFLATGIMTGRISPVNEAFSIAYGREPVAAELDWLSHVGVQEKKGHAAMVRSIIAVFDRQSYPTSINVRFSPEDLEMIDMGSFKMILDKSDISVSREILSSKDYEPHLRAFVQRTLKPEMSVIDIGANIGFYTLMFASIVGPRGKVFSFEPNTENCRLILLNLMENDFSHVQLLPFALSDRMGAAFFSPMMGSNGGFMPNLRETLTHPNCTAVPCQRLDAVINEPVDFIKVDVEGGEYLVLSGGEKLLQQFRLIIVAEFSLEMLQRVSGIGGADFLKWMTNFGYGVYLLCRDGSGLQKINDIDLFLANWRNPVRIEDLAFVPSN